MKIARTAKAARASSMQLNRFDREKGQGMKSLARVQGRAAPAGVSGQSPDWGPGAKPLAPYASRVDVQCGQRVASMAMSVLQ